MKRMLNGWRISPDFARAEGRFDPNGPHGYRASTSPYAPLRPTREQAENDEAEYRRTEVA